MTNDVLKNVALTVREREYWIRETPKAHSLSLFLPGSSEVSCTVNHMESLFWAGGFIYNNKTRRKFLSKIFKFLHRLISLIMFGMSLC